MKNDTNSHALQLQDLIQVLTERVEIYRTVISSTDSEKDVDLISFLEQCMQLSQQFKTELNGVLAKEDTSFSEREWTAGKLYTQWQEEKPSMNALGHDQVIDACEKTENALVRIFQQILTDTSTFTETTTAMLKSQAALQQEIAEQVKDARKANNKAE